MKFLENHEQFEQLIGRAPCEYDLPDLVVIWFSAQWCGPCKKVNVELLESSFPATWLKCDIDRNDYTAGYCGLRSIPSFLVVYKKKILGTKSSSITQEILAWLQSLPLI
jgi:thiol-disulfide isomerase/thioredoxin